MNDGQARAAEIAGDIGQRILRRQAEQPVGCLPGVPHPGLSCVDAHLDLGPGDYVVLIATTDPYTRLTPGDTGVIRFVDDLGTFHVDWDPDGHMLGLVPGVDVWRRLHPRWLANPMEEVK